MATIGSGCPITTPASLQVNTGSHGNNGRLSSFQLSFLTAALQRTHLSQHGGGGYGCPPGLPATATHKNKLNYTS
jgi:hypothetical protein